MATRLRSLPALLLPLACAVCAASCAPFPAPVAAAAPPPAPYLPPVGPVRLGQDTLTLLGSGPRAFAELERLLALARRRIQVEVYELGHPALMRALEAAVRRGVAVTVIDDPSEVHTAAAAFVLRAAGVDVVDYPVRALMIDHVKLLIVDGDVAVVGGINWGVSSPLNHDYDAELRGPAVRNLERVFLRDLVTCGRIAQVPAPLADPGVIVAATLPAAEIRPLVLALINAAQRSLRLELFDLTDTGIVEALAAAVQRGVSVRVLLDPSQHTSDPAFQALQAAGAAVRWYRSRGELLHAKAIVADATQVLFGSANWSGGGFARNHEVDIDLGDAPVVAAAMLQQMDADWAASA